MSTVPKSAGAQARARVPLASAASWSWIAAFGGGLVVLALGAAAVTTSAAAGAWGMGMVLVAAGAAAIIWAVSTLITGRPVAVRFGAAGALASAAAAIAAFAVDPIRMSILAVAPAVGLLLVAGVGCALQQRTRVGGDDSARNRPWRGASIIAVVIVAAVVTPALSAVESAAIAPVDGERVTIQDGGHHH